MASLGAKGGDAELDARIGAMLSRAARVHGLLRAMAVLAEAPSADVDAPQLGVQLTMQVAAGPASVKCQDGAVASGATLDPLTVPKVRHCNRLRAEFTNKGARPVDVTVLYIDST